MATVTVPGTGSSTISELFNNQFNIKLAQDISNALAAAGGKLSVTASTGPGDVPTPPPLNAGGINELLITAGGSYNILPAMRPTQIMS